MTEFYTAAALVAKVPPYKERAKAMKKAATERLTAAHVGPTSAAAGGGAAADSGPSRKRGARARDQGSGSGATASSSRGSQAAVLTAPPVLQYPQPAAAPKKQKGEEEPSSEEEPDSPDDSSGPDSRYDSEFDDEDEDSEDYGRRGRRSVYSSYQGVVLTSATGGVAWRLQSCVRASSGPLQLLQARMRQTRGRGVQWQQTTGATQHSCCGVFVRVVWSSNQQLHDAGWWHSRI
jgi:hypothetical protein